MDLDNKEHSTCTSGLTVLLDAELDAVLSPQRAAHSRRTAELAALLCSRFGIDPERGRVAGLAHDMCKELDREVQRRLAALYPGSKSLSSLMIDKALHGPAAATRLAKDYHVVDEEILEAVAVHTLGRIGMSDLAIAVYCADKLEPGREAVSPKFREHCLDLPAEKMLLEVVGNTVSYLQSRGKIIAPETLDLYNSLTDGETGR